MIEEKREMNKEINDFIQDIENKTNEINEIRQQLVDKLKPRFKDLFVPFLKKWPQIKRIEWTQYTPYFNDGEPCEFSVYDLNGHTNDCDCDEWERALPIYSQWLEEEHDWEKENMQKLRDKLKLSTKEIVQMNEDFDVVQTNFNKIPEDVMKDIFGDHAIITVTLEGIDCEEYDHD